MHGWSKQGWKVEKEQDSRTRIYHYTWEETRKWVRAARDTAPGATLNVNTPVILVVGSHLSTTICIERTRRRGSRCCSKRAKSANVDKLLDKWWRRNLCSTLESKWWSHSWKGYLSPSPEIELPLQKGGKERWLGGSRWWSGGDWRGVYRSWVVTFGRRIDCLETVGRFGGLCGQFQIVRGLFRRRFWN